MDNYAKAKLRKKISQLARKGILINKKIVLFGASVYSKEIKNCLLEYDIPISGIVDNDSRKIGTVCMGIKVVNPEMMLQPYNEDIIVLLYSGGYYREMTNQLSQMGYQTGKNVFILNFKVDESVLVLSYKLTRIIRGYFTHQKLTKGSQRDKVIFLAPYTGTGDIYLAGLFFNEYIRKHQITDYVFVVVSGACKKAAEMFNIKNIVILKPVVVDDIIKCREFLRAHWQVIVLNDGWLDEKSQWLRGYKDLHFEKVFRKFVFGFDDNTPHELPPENDYTKEVDEIFVKHGLIKGKTVVLSPYSNTLFDLPGDVLDAIVSFCKEQGYTVCTNCAGTEKPVPGTPSVFFPLNMAIAFMNTAGYFVGVRSGLCDIISSSTCRKVIIYEKDGFFYKSSQIEYFSLKKMRLCDDAVEIEYRDDLKNECLETIYDVLN